MKTLVILVHGFNVWDGGTQTVGKLQPYFNAHDDVTCVMLYYGHFGLWQARRKNDKVAKKLSEAVFNAKLGNFDRVIVVGHSNGCAIIYRAAKLFGCPIDKAVWINPALKKHYAPADCILAIDVWHSPSDKPVRWAKRLPFASSARPWGEMGATGYIGDDDRITNYNKESEYDISSKEHSDVFPVEKNTYFGPLIATTALN